MMETFKRFIRESLDRDSLAIYSGRFQPFTKGHQSMVEEMQKKYSRLHIFIVDNSKDKGRNPFSGDLRKEMIEACVKGAEVHVIPTHFIPGAIKFLKLWRGKEKVVIGSGDDRDYSKVVDPSKTPYEVEILKVGRDMDAVSGTKTRQAIKDGDFETYKNLAAKGIDTKEWFDRLKKVLNEIGK